MTQAIDGESVCDVDVSCHPSLGQNEPQPDHRPNIYSTLRSAFCLQFCTFAALVLLSF